MNRLWKSAIAVTVSILLMISFSHLVYADGTTSTTDPVNDLIIFPQGPLFTSSPAPSQFYVAFIDIVEAHVTLSAGVYTFEITVQSTPSDWLTATWSPAFTGQPNQPSISLIKFDWLLFDSSGPPGLSSLVGAVAAHWNVGSGISGGILRTCPPDSAPSCWLGMAQDAVSVHPASMTSFFDQPTNSFSVSVSASDLASFFSTNGLPMPTQWWTFTAAFSTGPGIADVAPDQATIVLPT